MKLLKKNYSERNTKGIGYGSKFLPRGTLLVLVSKTSLDLLGFLRQPQQQCCICLEHNFPKKLSHWTEDLSLYHELNKRQPKKELDLPFKVTG